jgi:predicted GH43/DUF377 family glycosyl hydrolase
LALDLSRRVSTSDGSSYRLGVALHDLNNPARIIGVADSWILQPEDTWEITGNVHKVGLLLRRGCLSRMEL